jgi:hypothetical protein
LAGGSRALALSQKQNRNSGPCLNKYRDEDYFDPYEKDVKTFTELDYVKRFLNVANSFRFQ